MRDSTHILSISALAATLTAAASDYTFNTEDYTATAQFIGFTKSPIQPTSSNHYYGNSTYTSGISSQSYPNSGVYTNNSTQSYSKMYLSTDLGIDSNISSSRGASLATNGLYTTFNVNSTAAGKVTLQQSDLKTSTLSSLSSVGTTTATTSSLTSNMSTANKSYVSSTSTADSVSLAGTTSTTYSSIMSSSSNTSGTTSTDSKSKTTSTTSSLSTSTLEPLTSSTTTSQKEAIATSSSTESISTTTSKSVSSTSSAFITSSSSEVSSSTSKPSTTSSSSEHTTSSTTTKESSTSTISTSTKKPSTSSSSTTTSSTSISTTTSDAANYGSTSPVDPLSVDPKIAAYQEIGNIGYLLDEDDSALLLKLHNDVRSLHEDTPDLVWNNTLVAQSYEYMQYLINEDPAYSPCSGNLLHSGGKFGSNVGENLAAATGIDDLTTLFDLWSSEGQYYDYDNPSLTGGTDDSTELGHFTQLVWKGTTAVGCGVQVCTDSDWTYLICRYYTEGNILYSGDTWKLFKQNVLPLSS